MREALRARLNGWLRHRSAFMARAGTPYLLLAVLAASTFTVRDEHGTSLLIDVSLCAVTAAWMLGMYTLNPAWRRRVPHMAVFVAGLLVLTAVLTARSGWFGFFIVVSLACARQLLPWPWPMYVAGGVALIGALSQTEDTQVPLPLHAAIFLIALAIDMLLIPTFMWLLHEREQRVEQHSRSLTELSEVNRRLEATIAENEVLHRQLLAQAREAGVLDERRRMAREIHDTLAQGLTGIVTQLQAAEQAAPRSPDGSAGWRHHVDADRGTGGDAAGRVGARWRHGHLGLRAHRFLPGRLVNAVPIRLLIADDHPVVRDGLTGMFAADPDFCVVGEAADGSQALCLAETVRPDVILMDLRMPGMDGVTAIAELARRANPARVLVLTTYDTDTYVLPAIEAGATGYLLKDAPRDELLRAVRAAAAGQSVLAPTVAARLMNRVRAPGPELLSQRELEVLGLVAAGTTNREAAARLFISEATVKTHLLHIYAKLGVTDRAAAVAEAFNRGLLTPAKPER